MTTLYKRDKNGKVRVWSIDYDNLSYWTESGQKNGKSTKTAPTFVTQKNVGRANETSIEQQVINEVNSKIQYQLEHGYSKEIPSEEKQFAVSLASKYEDRKEKNKLDFPYICEAKLDGIRCFFKKENDEIKMYSRQNKEFLSCPHLIDCEFIREFFDEYPNAILDGELYNHQLKENFNKIVSLVKKTKPKKQDIEESAELVQYHCFDVYFPDEADLSYVDRKSILGEFLVQKGLVNIDEITNTFVEIVSGPVHFVNLTRLMTDKGAGFWFPEVNDEEMCEKTLDFFVENGYEGMMLKKDVPYFFGRSFDMLKYKRFYDKEYKIIDFEEGKGNLAGIAASVICVDENENIFKAGVTGTQEYAKSLFENRTEYIGKLATIKFQELTPIKDGKGGVPRFGKMMSIRDYE